MRGLIAAALVLIGIALLAYLAPQLNAQPGTPTSAVIVSDTPPTSKIDGSIWIHKSSLKMYAWSDSLTLWIGQEERVTFDRAASAVADFLRFGGGQGVKADTTSSFARRRGYYAYEDMRLLRAYSMGTTGSAPACTTRMWYDDALSLGDLVWSANRNFWVPTADSTGGWYAPPVVVLSAGETFVPELVTAGGTNPDNPSMTFVFVPQRSP